MPGSAFVWGRVQGCRSLFAVLTGGSSTFLPHSHLPNLVLDRPEYLGNKILRCHTTQSFKLPASVGECFVADMRIIAQPQSVLARVWRILTGAPETQTILPHRLPITGSQIPEEGTNGGYSLFCSVKLGDIFNDGRYITVRNFFGYGQYSTVWLARDLR